jgi:hypothetical protein
VAITVLCVRIDISEKKTILDWKIFKEKLHLVIWTQAVALWGCLYFAAALVISQLLGFYYVSSLSLSLSLAPSLQSILSSLSNTFN